VLFGGVIVAVLVVVNVAGFVVDLCIGEFWGMCWLLFDDGLVLMVDLVVLQWFCADWVVELAVCWMMFFGGVTMFVVVVIDLILSKVQCAKVVGLVHDGFVCVVFLVYMMVDGDIVFVFVIGIWLVLDLFAIYELLTVVVDVIICVVVCAVLFASSICLLGGIWFGYVDVFGMLFWF